MAIFSKNVWNLIAIEYIKASSGRQQLDRYFEDKRNFKCSRVRNTPFISIAQILIRKYTLTSEEYKTKNDLQIPPIMDYLRMDGKQYAS